MTVPSRRDFGTPVISGLRLISYNNVHYQHMTMITMAMSITSLFGTVSCSLNLWANEAISSYMWASREGSAPPAPPTFPLSERSVQERPLILTLGMLRNTGNRTSANIEIFAKKANDLVVFDMYGSTYVIIVTETKLKYLFSTCRCLSVFQNRTTTSAAQRNNCFCDHPYKHSSVPLLLFLKVFDRL